MVGLTTRYVEKECWRTQASKSLTKELRKDHLDKMTHLCMNEKFIDAIGNFAACRNLRVVYLHDNAISRIENLHFAKNITHLYLQRNGIRKMENLECLRNLRSLFLGYNDIGVIEGLENLEKLKELHVERQRMDPGESLCFDPRSCRTLATTLRLLNVSGNNMTTLGETKDFQMLESLDARDNAIGDVRDLTETVRSLKNLRCMYLRGNPVARCYRYRENIIANTDSLACLDGKDIGPIGREFIKRFKIERHLQQTTKRSRMTLSDDITSSLNLPPAFKRSVTRAIFQHCGPKLSIPVASAAGQPQPQVFPSWRSASSIRAGSRDTDPAGIRRNLASPAAGGNAPALPPIPPKDQE